MHLSPEAAVQRCLESDSACNGAKYFLKGLVLLPFLYLQGNKGPTRVLYRHSVVAQQTSLEGHFLEFIVKNLHNCRLSTADSFVTNSKTRNVAEPMCTARLEPQTLPTADYNDVQQLYANKRTLPSQSTIRIRSKTVSFIQRWAPCVVRQIRLHRQQSDALHTRTRRKENRVRILHHFSQKSSSPVTLTERQTNRLLEGPAAGLHLPNRR